MRTILIGVTILSMSVPALPNSLVSPGPVSKIAKSRITATPDSEWNKLSLKPGKKVEIWTLDGSDLNQVIFFGGVEAGQPLFKEADKKRAPLPKVSKNMLVTDIPALLEATYRTRGMVNRMDIETQEPDQLNGIQGIKFTYRFVKDEDDVERRGEAFGAVKSGALFIVSYEAPALYFFERDVLRFRNLLKTVKF